MPVNPFTVAARATAEGGNGLHQKHVELLPSVLRFRFSGEHYQKPIGCTIGIESEMIPQTLLKRTSRFAVTGLGNRTAFFIA